ncbi:MULTISPECIES: ABC transporter substrate-binding protein [Methylobacterium]|uniref:Aliphatic sulfonates-binding protein n=1 Tax=Methylobacterium jeotgali TaxID=381630 RepID=A0ABQ4T0F8_9HYPH|nr:MULTISPECIES: ABC transporter substrate-binding protein [Methylobacterium]PIU05702.1 MAG: aliphatic sulfonates ABC transporter substrate-binding protein [Methylobacterium sp. CG09_land_8_20_14_0_10_71_15]PIU12412.1 MAG: aliphatic sulfonates ABC transporter substrate-binding protein [Methylobacterium sp. CG08_land_8_20_14_0_20_71_15]GBU16930.1 aliphatic sulfonate ABC transporter periplasmic binding protein [Methylobacterium sp.]GJE08897.1 Putative aliphatic sulfonates-binding protein [Methylo
MRARLLAALALICLGLGPARAEEVLRVGDQRGNARALMEAAGVLEGLSYRLEWSEFPAAAPLLEALNAGAIDVGGCGDAPFTFAAAAGVPVRAFLAFRNRQDGLAILVAPDSPIRTVADLKGKRIATNRGSIGHQVVLAALEEAGLPADSVRFHFLPPADAKLALASGAVDAWSTWEPYTSAAELAGLVRVLRDGNGITPGLSYAVASESALKAKRPLLADFAARLARARAWALADPKPYAAVWSKLIGLPEAVPLRWFGRAAYRTVPIDAEVIADEQRIIDLYVRAGLIPKARAPRAEAILDPSFTDAAAVR